MSVNLTNNTKQRLLLVEDHKSLAENLFEFLGEENYELDYAADGLSALHLLATNTYDVIILDIMLPGIDGLTICQRIRQDLKSNTPVLMLTAKDSIDDKTAGFQSGADDYLIKPFHLRELELRITALARRGKPKNNCLTANNLHYFPGTLTIKWTANSTTPVSLVLSGYAATIFECLIRHYPDFVSYQQLSKSLWGHPDGDSHTLRTHIYGLRKTLKHHFGNDMIKTLHGRGYSLDTV